eukprot:975643-Heterocapsa_arctica.AAC.1
MSKLGAVSSRMMEWTVISEGHSAVENDCTNKVQTKDKSGAKRLGHTLGEGSLNKVIANWLDEILAVAK